LSEELRRSVHTWLTQVLLPGRFPELPLAEARSLEEVDTMLAERVKEWTREWKREGLQEGLQKGLEKGLRKGRREGRAEGRAEGLQKLLLSQMEERFGPVPKTIRRRVEGIQDFEELMRLGKQLLAAASLDDLGL
jgi:flagellar biosynthesis/type III secretory pathway protein FliH